MTAHYTDPIEREAQQRRLLQEISHFVLRKAD
jgi:hypothetical protein